MTRFYVIILLNSLFHPVLQAASVTLSPNDQQLLKKSGTQDLRSITSCLNSGASINARDSRGCTPLMIASECGFSDIVELFLTRGAVVNMRSDDGNTALHYAVESGSLTCVKHLISFKADVNAQDSGGATPFAVACQHDRFEIAELLVKSCDVDLPMSGGITPLLYSAMRGKYWWVEFLLDYKANHAHVSSAGNTAMSFACIYFHCSIAHLLHKRGADFSHSNAQQQNLIMQTMAKNAPGRFSMVLFLIDNGVSCTAPDYSGTTPLHRACEDGDSELVTILLANNAYPIPSSRGDSPLVRAVKNCHYSIVVLLLSKDIFQKEDLIAALVTACSKGLRRIAAALIAHGADPSAENEQGITPLMAASASEHTLVISWLVSHAKVPIGYVNKHGLTAIDYACLKERHRLISFLKELGADLDVASPEHGTPLSIACNLNFPLVVKALIDAHAQLDKKGNLGLTPLMVTCFKNRKELAQLLIDRGAQLNLVNDRHQTALVIACQYGSLDSARLLIDRGADLSIRTSEDLTALHYASSLGHSSVVDLLIEKGVPVDILGTRNSTPLLLACEAGRLKVVKALIKHKANIFVHNDDGVSPIICARACGHHQIVTYLKARGVEAPPDTFFIAVALLHPPKATVDEQALNASCGYCREGNAPQLCTICKRTHYCDTICQEAHRSAHQQECSSRNGFHKNGYQT